MKKSLGPILLPFVADSQDFKKSETRLSSTLTFILHEVQKEVGMLLEDTEECKTIPEEQLQSILSKVQERLGFDLTPIERNELIAQLERESKPFGILQSLVDDPSISDIIITDYTKVCIQQGRKNFKTDTVFASQEAYESFVEKLLNRAGASYSTKKPIADGMIGSFARVHAVHRSLCDTGPYVTIRLNRFSSVCLDDLARLGLAPFEILSYLKGLVVTGHTILIAGEVGTGKTTLARAIASDIPGEESIVVIEDTAEIRLEHPHVRYLTTREANTEGSGRISPSECIRAGMRMAMNRIIFGEIRDAEAAESFIDVCASGHPGLSTIHARSAEEAVVRLELFLGRAQKGVEKNVLTEQISTAVQVIVHVDICKVTGKRRIMEVQEIGAVADGVLRHREMFRYEPRNSAAGWKVISKTSSYKDKLESLTKPVLLNQFPSYIEPSIDVLYREAGSQTMGAVC